MDKAAFSIIHVNRNKRETGLPFIAEPAASDDCLRDLFVSEKIQQDKKDKPPPAVICMEYDRDAKQCQKRGKLHPGCFPEIFQRAECQISDKESKKDVLFIGIMAGVGKHIIPRNFGNQCKQQKISAVFPAVMCMKETFYNKETKDRKGTAPDITDNAVCRIAFAIDIKQSIKCRWVKFQYDRTGMVDQHGNTGDHFEHTAA